MSSPETKRKSKRKKKTTPPTNTPKKKKRTKQSTPESALIPSLPDDLALSIVARVSRLYYPILSLVSKSFRSLVASPDLYKARSLLGTTESCLYACFNCLSGFRWFTLCRKPDHHQTLTNNEEEEEEKKKTSTTTTTTTSGYALASIPIPNTPYSEFASMVAVGSEIYNIGAEQPGKSPSSSVFILDCQSHTWRTAPSLPVELYTVSVGVIDGKIYATGLCDDDDPNNNLKLKNSLSLFDPKTQAWDPQPLPCRQTVGTFSRHSASIDGKLHVVAHKMMAVYDVKESKWDVLSNRSMYYGMVPNSYCQIDNVVYSASPESFRWYDIQAGRWRVLQGLVGLPTFRRDSVFRLANFGGKLAVMWWQTISLYTGKKKICCAEIALERRSSSATCEIWGKVEWFDHVLTLTAHAFDEFISIIAATV
ncbi:PREDICTED: F-box/kelch-repeat protein At5g51250-like [Camelina sativa]|uniref:F-box/kelch-repeat protein At5g51250-like n=1 Tax=Camelina sativa TaxID=90675 RepID=A0ABM0XRD8_CAMSA|nr:PREDICTED: F-box/kelch-repeat protein At5g51250-like [Camelina sativa]